MTRLDWIDELRADLRPADPDPVMLAQLVALSHASVAPAVRTGQSVGARLAITLGGVIAVGATSWAAGALPGTDSPFQPEDNVTHHPTGPTPGDVASPRPDDSRPPAGGASPPPAGDRPRPSRSADQGAPVPGGTPSPPASRAPQPFGTPRLPGLPPVPPLPGLTSLPTVPVPRGLDDVVEDLPVEVEDLLQPAPGTDRGIRHAPGPREAPAPREQ